MKSRKEILNLTPVRLLQLILFLYLFLVSIALMGASMKMFGKGFAEALITNTSNPFVGLFIGILATSLIQSSSSTTSIVVGMVGCGALNVVNAIPIVMGANIGTSVTNTLVSIAHVNRSNEFHRSFSASTVHDFFNIMAVIIIFPLQYSFDFLDKMAIFLGNKFVNVGGQEFFNPIKTATKPLVTFFTNWMGDYPWILLIIALLILFLSLKQIVNALRVLVVKKAEKWFDKVLFKNAVRAFTVGLLLTVLAQSSSITTSLIVPMAGAGILTLEQIFPYTLGANIGTTVTAMLAALAIANVNGVVVAFAHLLFNISGIVIIWPFRKAPIFLARKLSDVAVRSKLFPFLYIIVVFFILPLTMILLFR
jgi:sodium-dependent phosphate cotransporter